MPGKAKLLAVAYARLSGETLGMLFLVFDFMCKCFLVRLFIFFQFNFSELILPLYRLC